MATVGSVMAKTSQTNDLHGFFPKSNPERFFYRVQRHPLRKPDPVGGPLAPEPGITKKETGNTQKQSKQEPYHSSAFGKFRSKARPVKSVPVDNSSVSIQGPRATSANQSQPFASPEACARTEEQRLSIVADRGSNLRLQNFEEIKRTVTDNKRGMVKRSVSAVGEVTDRGGQSTQSTVHSSCISGQRLAEWKDPSRFDVDIRNDVIAKRLSLIEQRSRTPSAKILVDTKGAPESAALIREYLTVLAGSPYVGPGTKAPTDRSLLIELDRAPFAAAKNSFDNVAATENSNDTRHPGQGGHPSGGQPSSISADPLGRVDGEPTPRHPTTPRTVEGKKKKWFPALRVKIPEGEDGSIGPKINLKKLSAADERKIEEVLELAGTFGRLGTSDHRPSTPRTPGASSKDSKESLASSSDSPTSHFRFSFFKGRKEEKKTFAEELASHLTDPNSLLTPEALEAYEKLVSRGSNEAVDSGTKNRLSKQTARQAHRSSLRTKLLRRNHPQRNSLSESDKNAVPENIPLKRSGKTGHGRLMHFGSTGGTLKNCKTLTEPNLFAWFDQSSLNTTGSEQKHRPKFLQSDLSYFGTKGNAFPLAMPSQNPGIQLPPRGGRVTKVESTRRLPPPPPSTGEKPDPPPVIPPRVPHRQSTVNSSSQPKLPKHHHHHHHHHQTSRDKPRSYSEGVSTTKSMKLNLYDIPRRYIRSTDTSDGASPLSEPQSPTTHNLVNSSHGSDDSVFDHLPRSPHSTIPIGQSALGASRGALGSSSRGTKSFGPYRSMSVKNVKVKAKELGISDKNDPFWGKNVTLDLSESHSESDLLREAAAPIPGFYETSDCISYEDLMEFALDGPQRNNRRNNSDSTICDEIRLMRKMFSNDVTVDDCMDALVETGWNVHHAVKLIKLKQLIGTGLGTQEQCKDALMACNWNVDEAATFLLPPPPPPPAPPLPLPPPPPPPPPPPIHSSHP